MSSNNNDYTNVTIDNTKGGKNSIIKLRIGGAKAQKYVSNSSAKKKPRAGVITPAPSNATASASAEK